ncbi:MAG: hypothetical protein ACRCUJ_07030 [Phocaeicola sp.]
MPYIDISGDQVPQKALPVTTNKRVLHIKFQEGFDPYRQRPWYSVLFRNYFKLWDSLGLHQVPVIVKNLPEVRVRNELHKLQRTYDRYREFKLPFVPPLKTYLCKCGKPEIDEYGLCANCILHNDSTQRLTVALWLAKKGRIIARTDSC